MRNSVVTVAGVCRRHLSSSVTLHGGPAGVFTRAGQAMTSCHFQSNYSSTATSASGQSCYVPLRRHLVCGCSDVVGVQTGGVVCRLTESSYRVAGLTCLNDTLYVLRCRDSDQIEFHVLECSAPPRFCLRRCLSLPRLYRDDWNDLASSGKHRRLYVSNFSMNRIQAVDLRDSSVTLWPLPDSPCGLSITRDENLLVTFQEPKRPGKVMEIDGGSGSCLRKLVFEDGVLWTWHTVDVQHGQYLVSHGYYDQHNHCVSLVAAADGRKVRSYGGIRGSDVGKLYVPYHVTVDRRDGRVYVADHHNGRVVILSAELQFLGCLASQDRELRSRPRRLCLDLQAQLIYVGQDDGTVTAFQL